MAELPDDNAPSAAASRGGPVVAISATYGAGGALIGERVAAELRVPFLPHLFTSEQMDTARQRRVARNPAAAYLLHRVRGDEAQDDRTADVAVSELATHRALEESDEEVRALAGTGGVVVGRAGPHLLRDEPQVLHVLLDGPTDARIRAGAQQEGVDEETAAGRQLAHDESRLAIARLHYGVDPHDLRFYHLVIDTTALGVETAVSVVVAAARGLQGG